MSSSLLVRLFGFHATLIHGDTMVLDRWRWIRKRLPVAHHGESLLDVGCGSGAFTIGAARHGYRSTGLTWNPDEQAKAKLRAAITHNPDAAFEVFDVRRLEAFHHPNGNFDVAVCCENIEHIINDQKLMCDIANLLEPGGRLLLTSPNYHFRAIHDEDDGPVTTVENGGHVRRGYNETMLRDLCTEAGLDVGEVSYCSGFLSQKITGLLWRLSKTNSVLAWLLVLPLRPIPLFLDPLIQKFSNWPWYTICLVAHKPPSR